MAIMSPLIAVGLRGKSRQIIEATERQKMVEKVGKFSEKNAERAFARAQTKDLVDRNISSRFSGSPPADKKQAAADLKVMTAQPKPTPVRFRYGRV
jgi:hypothetical protein